MLIYVKLGLLCNNFRNNVLFILKCHISCVFFIINWTFNYLLSNNGCANLNLLLLLLNNWLYLTWFFNLRLLFSLLLNIFVLFLRFSHLSLSFFKICKVSRRIVDEILVSLIIFLYYLSFLLRFGCLLLLLLELIIAILINFMCWLDCSSSGLLICSSFMNRIAFLFHHLLEFFKGILVDFYTWWRFLLDNSCWFFDNSWWFFNFGCQTKWKILDLAIVIGSLHILGRKSCNIIRILISCWPIFTHLLLMTCIDDCFKLINR